MMTQLQFSLKRPLPNTVDLCHQKLAALSQSYLDTRDLIKTREMTKNYALGTSKLNYMDPRITVSFSKRTGLAIDKVFNKANLSKFPWALDVGKEYKFTNNA